MSVLSKVWVNACLFLVCHGPDAFWNRVSLNFFGFMSICMLAVQCKMKNAIWLFVCCVQFKVGDVMQYFLKNWGEVTRTELSWSMCWRQHSLRMWHLIRRADTDLPNHVVLLFFWTLDWKLLQVLGEVQFYIVAGRDLYCLEVSRCNNIWLSHLRHVRLYVVPTIVGWVYMWMRKSWWSISIMISRTYP